MARKAVISSCLLVEGQLHQNLKCLAMLIEIEEAVLLKGTDNNVDENSNFCFHVNRRCMCKQIKNNIHSFKFTVNISLIPGHTLETGNEAVVKILQNLTVAKKKKKKQLCISSRANTISRLKWLAEPRGCITGNGHSPGYVIVIDKN